MTENDTTSHISTGAKSVPVFDDNDEVAGSAQVFTSVRSTEAAALSLVENPQFLPPARTVEQHRQDMLKQGKIECSRCLEFKYFTEFGKDERNTERFQRQSMCLQCDSERVQIKRQVIRRGVRSEGYRYQQRKAKRRRRK